MTLAMKTPAEAAAPAQPRAIGALRISSRLRGRQSVLDGLRQSGALKALFPRAHGGQGGLQAVLINTAGGITGGDRFRISAEAGGGSHLTLTTQAAERAYRARPGECATWQTDLAAGAGARLDWLPQETILFDGCAVRRRLSIDLAADATLLMVEPLIFGRTAMGERLTGALFHDRVEVRRDGVPLYLDAARYDGDVAALLARPAVAGGAGAMASLVYAAPDAERHLRPLRALLPDTGGASVIRPGLLALRLLAGDGHALRQCLLPVLDRLTDTAVPASWRL